MTLFARSALWINSTIVLVVDQGSRIIDMVVPPLIQQVIAVTLYGEPALTLRAHHTDPVLIDDG